MNIKPILLSLFAMAAGLSLGCKKEKSGGSASSAITATVDGTAFKGAHVTVEVFPPDPELNDHLMLSIIGGDQGMHTLSVSFTFPDDALHSGSFTEEGNVIVLTEGGNLYSSEMCDQTQWSLTLTKASDHELEGSFSATLANGIDPTQTRTVTDGHFHAKY